MRDKNRNIYRGCKQDEFHTRQTGKWVKFYTGQRRFRYSPERQNIEKKRQKCSLILMLYACTQNSKKKKQWAPVEINVICSNLKIKFIFTRNNYIFLDQILKFTLVDRKFHSPLRVLFASLYILLLLVLRLIMLKW